MTARLALAAIFILSATLRAEIPPVWFGTWVAISETTTLAGPPIYKRATYTIAPADGGMHVMYGAVLVRGGVVHLEWTGAIDGRERQVQGAEEYLTYAYRSLPDGSYELVARIDGRVAATATVTFAADGRTMTTVTRATAASGQRITTTTVYAKS